MSTLAEQSFQLFQHLPAGWGHGIGIPPNRDTSAATRGRLVEVIHRTEQAGAPQSRKRESHRRATQASFTSRPPKLSTTKVAYPAAWSPPRGAVSAAILAASVALIASAHGAHAAMSAQASRSGEHETSSSWFPRHPRPHLKCVCRRIRSGAPGGIRTPDPRLRRPMLYPTELQARPVATIHQLAGPDSQSPTGQRPAQLARRSFPFCSARQVGHIPWEVRVSNVRSKNSPGIHSFPAFSFRHQPNTRRNSSR